MKRLGVVVLLLVACSRPSERVTTLIRPVPPARWYPAVVRQIVDADTLDLDISLGWRIQITERVRLETTSCPEKHTPAGRRALEWVHRWVKLGDAVDLKTYTFDKEKYGRTLGAIYLTNGDELGASLIAAGVCRPPDGRTG